MDIAYMKTRNGYINDSNFVGSEFIKENPEIAIPYLIILSAFTLSGCVGNIMVIGAIVAYKVSWIIFFTDIIFYVSINIDL